MSVEVTETGLNLIPAGYKQTEVGVIPKDWEISQLRDLLKTPPKYGINAPAVPLEGKLPVYIRITDISEDGYFKPSEKVGVKSQFSSQYQLANGDIVLARTGASVGKSYLYKEHDGTLIYAGFLIKVSPDKNILEPRFLSQYLQTQRYWSWVNVNSMRSGQPGINGNEYGSLLVPLPKIDEQNAIATALSDVDALISELEKLIAKKQAIKTATMQQLLTGRTRLPQFALREDGTKKGTKKSELGEIPEDWKILAMGDLGSTYGGLSGKSKQDFGHGNSLYVPFTNVMANVVVDVDNLEKVDVRETQNNLALGDLLFNGSSETPEEVCFSALVSADIRKLYLNSFCFGFRSNQKNAYLPLYLAYWFRSEVGRAAVLVMAQGSTRYNISKSQFMKLPIVLPDTEEQTAIATILSDMDAEIQALNQRLSKTRQIKQGMMQELLTGKTRLVQPVNKESQHD